MFFRLWQEHYPIVEGHRQYIKIRKRPRLTFREETSQDCINTLFGEEHTELRAKIAGPRLWLPLSSYISEPNPDRPCRYGNQSLPFLP
jgi:hypothetical protein